jgi:bifunctional DNA-binding transcriptional regulator/antitoxin component of YhaV-PrlF toxin-antitoxin module
VDESSPEVGGYSEPMAATKNIFEVSVYKKSPAFNIPKRIRNEMGISGGDSIHLIVKTPSGRELKPPTPGRVQRSTQLSRLSSIQYFG